MKLLDIPTLNQRDPRWKGQRLGTCNGITIGSDGCVITSACMLLSWYGIAILPNALDDKLTDGKLYASGCQVVNANLPRLYPAIQWVKNINCKAVPAPISDIKQSIDNGFPLFIWVVNEGVEHCTLGVGYDGDQVIVNDPWRGDRVNIKDRWGNAADTIIYVNYFTGPKITNSPQPNPPMATLPPELQKYSINWKEIAVNKGFDVNSAQFADYRAIDKLLSDKLKDAMQRKDDAVRAVGLDPTNLKGSLDTLIAQAHPADQNDKYKELVTRLQSVLKDIQQAG